MTNNEIEKTLIDLDGKIQLLNKIIVTLGYFVAKIDLDTQNIGERHNESDYETIINKYKELIKELIRKGDF